MHIDTNALKSHLKKHSWIWISTLIAMLVLLAAILIPAIHGKPFRLMSQFGCIFPAVGWTVEGISKKELRNIWIGVAITSIFILAA